MTSSVRIKVFRNGDRNHFGKQFVINRRYVRTFGDVLQTINEHGDFCARRVKRLCTPTSGTEVRRIESIQNKQTYVAVDVSGTFQLLPYSRLEAQFKHRLDITKAKRDALVAQTGKLPDIRKSVTTGFLPTHNVYKVNQEAISIFVYCNGVDQEAARRVILNGRMLKDMKYVCGEITDRLRPHFGLVTKLYTLSGSIVLATSSLAKDSFYVAAGRYCRFMKLNYGEVNKPAFKTAQFKFFCFDFPSAAEINDVQREQKRTALDKSYNGNHGRVPRIIYADSVPVFKTRLSTIESDSVDGDSSLSTVSSRTTRRKRKSKKKTAHDAAAAATAAAAIKIQKIVRGYIARRRLKEKVAAMQLQTWHREHSVRDALQYLQTRSQISTKHQPER